MSERLDKIGAERDRAKEQRDKWEARYKELCQKYIQQENTEIHDLVRAQNLNPDQLAAVLAMLKTTMPGPEVAATAAPAPGTPDYSTSDYKEDSENED